MDLPLLLCNQTVKRSHIQRVCAAFDPLMHKDYFRMRREKLREWNDVYNERKWKCLLL